MRSPAIYPTFTCFDDALEFLGDRVKADPVAAARQLMLVHGICLAPEGPKKGTPFAHAWVEEMKPEGVVVWQAGILEGQRVLYSVGLQEFTQSFQVQQFTRYTVHQAALENERTCHFGPWIPEYEALCNHGPDEIFGGVDAELSRRHG